MSSFPPGRKECWRAQLVMDSSEEGVSPGSIFNGKGPDITQGGKPLELRTTPLSWHCSFAIAVSYNKNHITFLEKRRMGGMFRGRLHALFVPFHPR